MNSLPPLSHLQYAVLDCLGSAELDGRELRRRLKEMGISKTGPAFYQLMSRLEEGEMIEGWYDQKVIEGQMIRERRYRIRGQGVKAYQATQRFYERTTTSGRLLPGIA